MSFVFDGHVQFLSAAFEFQIGIVVFDFRFDHMKTFAARVGDDFFRQRRNRVAACGQLGFVFEFAVALTVGFNRMRACGKVNLQEAGRRKLWRRKAPKCRLPIKILF